MLGDVVALFLSLLTRLLLKLFCVTASKAINEPSLLLLSEKDTNFQFLLFHLSRKQHQQHVHCEILRRRRIHSSDEQEGVGRQREGNEEAQSCCQRRCS